MPYQDTFAPEEKMQQRAGATSPKPTTAAVLREAVSGQTKAVWIKDRLTANVNQTNREKVKKVYL